MGQKKRHYKDNKKLRSYLIKRDIAIGYDNKHISKRYDISEEDLNKARKILSKKWGKNYSR